MSALPAADACATLEAAPAPSLRRVIVFGAVGGLTFVAMELLLLPFELASVETRGIVLRVTPQWIIAGIGIALLVALTDSRWSARAMAAALVAYAWVMSIVFALARHAVQVLAHPSDAALAGALGTPWSSFFYDLWIFLFFGALFMLACVLQVRRERVRALLARLAIERDRSVALLAETQIRTLQAHVDPAFLLAVIDEVQRRYAWDADDADRLVNRLVAFLRLAMPGVRTGVSTLAAEVELASAYCGVWKELAGAAWSIRAEQALPALAFPPLWIIPALDCLADPQTNGRAGTLSVRSDATGTRLSFHASARRFEPVGAGVQYRLRVRLAAVLGDAWSLSFADPRAGDQRTLMTLFLPAAPGAAHEAMPIGGSHERCA